MTTIAVVAHKYKTLGGGLPELRQLLADRGYVDPLWFEGRKSRDLPQLARRAAAKGAEIIFLWGGDGTVQRCIDALAGENVTIAILPAGTANLLALNLGIPTDLTEAVDIGLSGDRRKLDVGVLNGRRFAVMAGIGFDAIMMHAADRKLKDRFGRLAYVWTGSRATHRKPALVRIEVDGKKWFKGKASCILLGQMGSLMGGITPFPEARPDDGLLEVGVVTAENMRQWARVLGRVAVGQPHESPLLQLTRGHDVDVKLNKATRYELDGGARSAKKRLRASVEPLAITICVPAATPAPATK